MFFTFYFIGVVAAIAFMHLACKVKYNQLLFATVVTTGLFGLYMDNHYKEILAVDATVPTNLVKTVAHVEPPDGYEVYSIDYEADVAYLIPTEDAVDSFIGEDVTLRDGTASTIVESNLDGFSITLPDGVTAAGLSGSHVLNSEGVPIGIISKLLGTDRIWCLWYRI